MSTHPPGRPRSLTLKKQQELLAHVARGGTVEEAAKIVGVSIRTVQREAKGNEHFDHDLQLAQHTATVDPETLMKRAARTHWRAAAWLLERTDPDRYGKRSPTSCRPENVYDMAYWLIETALESVPPEHRELLYRRMNAATEKMLDVFMPHPDKVRGFTRALGHRPMPLSSHEERKTTPIVGDCDPSFDYIKSIEVWVQANAANTPEAICATKAGDAAISDADFARRLTLIEPMDKPYQSKELPHEYCEYATPKWKLEQAAPSEREAKRGAAWDAGVPDLEDQYARGDYDHYLQPWSAENGDAPRADAAPASGGGDEEILSPKMKETTKPEATEPTAAESATETDAHSAVDAGPSYEEMVTGIHERRERYLAAIAAAREAAGHKKASRNGDAKARSWLDRFRTRDANGDAA
jgi:hypothetical protein